ncbi:TKL family protein kinase [Tritrichomonas foetus]|uniref:TKL family protein kinase n=1 Tax=Tritrichomonas foetus TaxID=1144522 RepID=A0A1J4JFM0_9EUKA|nr:TKL family protein kinase [Tritrichomonas foetus]|eukprot:OHS96261.1 TKL family protein kinase [Tritrichomonas foetus]
MQIGNLPTTLGQWKRYFDITYTYIESVVPTISFGHNKIDLIMTNLQAFRTNFLRDHPPEIKGKDARILFDFFKSCTAFISFASRYGAKSMLSYFLKHPINEQYNELSLLWKSWSLISSSLLTKTFLDINGLCYAHYLDMVAMYETFKSAVHQLPVPVANAVKNKLDDILLILGKVPPQQDKQFPGIIQHNQFQNIKEVGRGAFAQVNLAKMVPSGEEVAVKELKSVKLSKRNILSLKRELNALLKLKHPNVIEYCGVTVTPPFCIATRYLPNGCLFDALHGKNAKKLSPTTRLKIACGLARGLEYLDAMRFIHRDFKSQNILLDEDYNAVICDFGFARQIGPNMTLELGTIQWTAPEVLQKGEGNYDSSVDVYSLGLILYELLSCEVPYRGYFVTQIAAMVVYKNVRPELPANTKPEMANLIRNCWVADPAHRPKAEVVRKYLESGTAIFEGTNVREYMAWVNQTRPQHEAIMKRAIDRADHEMAELLEKIHTINPLDPTALLNLQQLYHMDYQLTIQLFKDILRLINQNLSLPVQDAAYDIMKQMLSKDSITEIIKPEIIVDEIITMIESQPLFVITALKLIANKITNVPEMIKKFLSMPNSHVTLEVIQALISQNIQKLQPKDIVETYNALTGRYAIGFFRFMITIFGPLPEFLPLACKSLFLLSLYIKGLANLCETNSKKVKAMINIEEVRDGEDLQNLLDSVSNLLVNPEAEINEKTASIIYKYIVNNCFTYNATETILPLLNTCARVGTMKAIIAQSDVWNFIIGGLSEDGEELKNALLLIERIPICNDTTLRILIWKTLVDKYIKTKDKDVTHAMCSLLNRRTDFDLANLIPCLLEGLTSDDNNYCVTALKLARRFKVDVYSAMNTDTFWKSLTAQMEKKDEVVCKSIGKLVTKMIEQMETFSFDPQFYGSVISLLYDPNTTFDTAMPFIVFLGASCRVKKIVIFLYKRCFVRYLEQLPWRYENEPRVADAIEYCASIMNRFYSASA